MGALIRHSGLWQSADKIAGQRAWGPKGRLRQGSRRPALKGTVSSECFPPDPSFAWWPHGCLRFGELQHFAQLSIWSQSFWSIAVMGQTNQTSLLSGVSIVLINLHQLFLSEPSQAVTGWGSSSPLSTRADMWLQQGHICLKIKLYISHLLLFQIHRSSVRSSPTLGKMQYTASSLPGYLCYYVLFGLYILEIESFEEGKKKIHLGF